MIRRLTPFLLMLAAVVAAVLAPAPALGRSPDEADRVRQQRALATYRDVDIQLDAAGVPEHFMGALSAREDLEPEVAASKALWQHREAFRRGASDGFAYRVHETDALGQTHVRMSQTFRGIPVVGGELIVHMSAQRVVGINGRFVSELEGIAHEPALSDAHASAIATDAVARDGGSVMEVLGVGAPVIWALSGEPRLTIPVKVAFQGTEAPGLDDVYVDALTGQIAGRLALLHTAKFRSIYNLNQACLQTGQELPGTFMFQEGGTSSDAAAMGAYNNTGTSWDFYKNVFNRDSFDNAGGTLKSSVHSQFSTGFFGCTKNNAAWLGDPYWQMVYGDGDGNTLGNLALSLDVTAHELTHGVCSKTANLVYQNESGALNEANSDILGRAAAFWAGQGNPAVQTDWGIGADVYTPSTPNDALRYMYDPAKDGQSADYWPTRNYASGCTPSQSNDQCGVHTNSGIANLFFYLLSQGGTHPRGKTTVSVPAIGITNARALWYRALVTYMTSSTTFQGARTATAQATADLFGGTCTSTWQAVHKAWDAVGVPGTWSCTGTTYSISGNAGTPGATVSAGSSSTTSDASGSYTIANLAAGTYTVTASKAGCTFSPASQSVTVGPNATGRNFTATCSGPTTYSISGSAGTSGATVTAGSSSTTSDASGSYTIGGLAAGTYTVTASKAGCTFSPAALSVTVGPDATGKSFTATCGGTGSQLLANPGFESGNVSWTASAGVITSSASRPARTGSWKAWLNGYGFISSESCYQQVTIPASATSATLSFWIRIDTAETTTTRAYDTLRVQVRNASNTVLATLATYSNLNKSASYVQKTFNLTAYKGQTIRIYFSGLEDASLQTSFVIDDTSLTVQ